VRELYELVKEPENSIRLPIMRVAVPVAGVLAVMLTQRAGPFARFDSVRLRLFFLPGAHGYLFDGPRT